MGKILFTFLLFLLAMVIGVQTAREWNSYHIICPPNESGEQLIQSMSNGDESFSQAHEAHLQLLQQEMNTQEPQITMLMAHAEDQLMSAETIKTLIQEIILLIESRGK